jgi:phosphatidylserine/phosphatidylglycerophosphate/cardiolipin synthase-like enzyme
LISTNSRKESGGSSTIVKDSGILYSPIPAKRNIINKRRVINKSRSSSQNKSLEDIAQQQFQQQQLLEMQQNVYNDGRMDFLTEQVYIHSKLMIVDDKTVICGSGKYEIRFHCKHSAHQLCPSPPYS